MRKLQFKQRYQHFLTTTDLYPFGQMGNLTKVLNAGKIINILNFMLNINRIK